MPSLPDLVTVHSSQPGRVPASGRGLTLYGRGDGFGLREAAQDFEALFLEGVVKGFRRTTLDKGGREKRLYRALLDEELARVCATRGMGVAKVLETRLGKACGSDPPGVEGSLKVSYKGPICPSGAQGGPEKALGGRAAEGVVRTGTCMQRRRGLSGRGGTGSGPPVLGTPVFRPHEIGLELLPGVARRGVYR